MTALKTADQILASVGNDLSPAFTQRFLTERGLVAGRGYGRDQTIARLAKLAEKKEISLELLRDLVIDWRESGDKHVYLLRLQKADALAAIETISAMPQLAGLPGAVTSDHPMQLYAVASGSRARVAYGELQSFYRAIPDELRFEQETVERRAIVEIDAELEIASVSCDPYRGGSLLPTAAAGYYSAYQDILLSLAPQATNTVDLSAAMLAIEDSDLVSVRLARGVDDHHHTVQVSGQSELRGPGTAYADMADRVVVREAARYWWVAGKVVVSGNDKLTLHREIRTDIDASGGIVRLPSQTTSLERRYVLAAIDAHS